MTLFVMADGCLIFSLPFYLILRIHRPSVQKIFGESGFLKYSDLVLSLLCLPFPPSVQTRVALLS